MNYMENNMLKIVMSTCIESSMPFKNTVVLGFGGSGTGKTTLLLSHEHSFVKTFLDLCPQAIMGHAQKCTFAVTEHYWKDNDENADLPPKFYNTKHILKFKNNQILSHNTADVAGVIPREWFEAEMLKNVIENIDEIRRSEGRICNTTNNKYSSRSVMVYTFIITYGSVCTSTLKFIDLPGYENQTSVDDLVKSNCKPKASKTSEPIVRIIKDSIGWCRSKGKNIPNSEWKRILENENVDSDNIRIISMFLFNNLSNNVIKRQLYYMAYNDYTKIIPTNNNFWNDDVKRFMATEHMVNHISDRAYKDYKNMQLDQIEVARLLSGSTVQ